MKRFKDRKQESAFGERIRNTQYPVKEPRQQFITQLLQSLKQQRAQQPSAQQKQEDMTPSTSWFKELFNKPATIGAFSFAVIALVAVGIWQLMPGEQTTGPTYVAQQTYTTIPYPTDGELDDLFTLEPVEETANGIVASTAFKLTSAMEFTEEQVREAFSFTPEVAYAAELTEEQQYLIRAEAAFDGDSLVTAQMNVQFEREDGSTITRTYSWTYQVEDTFKINSTFPENRSNDVPAKSSIELALSHEDVEYGENVFTFEPAVSGRVEQHRSTLVFIPDEPLQKSTIYTVTINGDITQTGTGEVIAAGRQFQFETRYGDSNNDRDKQFRIETMMMQTATTKQPQLVLDGDYGTKAPVNLKVYSMSRDQYIAMAQEEMAQPTWAYYATDVEADLTGLTTVMEAEVQLQEVNYYQRLVEFPDTLAGGYYYAQVTRGERTGGAMLQVSDISAFNAVSRTDTVVWAHNAATSKPIANATVEYINGGAVGSTGSNGVMQEPTPQVALEGLRTELMLITKNESELLLPLSGSLENTWDRVEDIDVDELITPVRSFIHPSKPFYKPTDTLSAWGTIKAQDFEPLGEVTVALVKDDWRNGTTDEIYSEVVTPDSFGTYDVHFPLGGLQPDTYNLVVKIGGTTVRRTYVEVLNYQLPAYTLSVSPTRLAVFDGETATHTVTAALYDGTPLSQTDISIGNYNSRENFTTGSDGVIDYTRTYEKECYDEVFRYNHSCSTYVEVSPAEGEQGYISADFDVLVFPSAYGIKPQARVNDGEVSATGTVHAVDLEKYNTGEAITDEDALTDPIANTIVTFEVIEHWTTKEETGTEYDPIRKRTITLYEYNRHERVFTTGSVETNREGEFEYVVPNTDENRNYEINMSVTDQEGRSVTQGRWAYQEYTGDNTFHFYRISLGQEDNWSANNSYAVGETVTARMLDSEQLLPEDDSFLFLQARNGIRQVEAQTSPVYEFEFEEEDVPSVVVMGVWYDGTGYWATPHETGFFERGARAVVDTADKELDAAVTFDKEQYGPGDTVVMDLEFTGGKNSRETTAVHVVAIDEALFDLQHTWLGGLSYAMKDKYFADSYYRGHDSGIYGTYSSHQEMDAVTSAEGGGGADKRTDFSDQAAFITTTTGKDGRAQVQFDLPDSLTSWNVVVYAIDGEEYIAEEVRSIRTTLPLQATAVLNEVYQAGDQPDVKVRAYGTDLSQEEEVTVTLESEDLGLLEQEQTVTGSADAYFTLPALPVGEHTITFAVEAGDHSDTVERTISVRPSLSSIPVVEQVSLEGEWKPEINAQYGAEITLTDKSIGQFYPYLRNAYWQYSDRLDLLAARQRATALLGEWFNEQAPAPTVDYNVYQQADGGGLQLFSYGGIDLYSSVLVTAALEGEIDATRLTRYYSKILNEPTEGTRRHAQALAGLATLRQPVLNEAEQMLAHEAVTDGDKVYIAYALARMGAHTEAREVMDTVYNQYYARSAVIATDQAEAAELNIVAAITMALIQMDGADDLFAQFVENAPESVATDLGVVEFIAARINHVPMQPATVTYTKQGAREVVELEPGETATIRLAADQLDDFSILSSEGALFANMEYQALDVVKENTLDGVTITRDADWSFANEGDVIPVTIRVEGGPENFTILDTIPAGFRIITNPINFDDWYAEPSYAYPYGIDQQQVRFCGCNDSNTYRYYVQAVQPGVYTADAPMIQAMNDPSQQAFGESDTVQLSR